MTPEKDYESVVEKAIKEDTFTVIYLRDKFPHGFLGDYIEIDGEKYELLDDEIFPNVVFIKGTGDFEGKRVFVDKWYFKRT